MMSYLHTKFHDNWISSFWGVAMTRFWDGRKDGRRDGVTRLLDLLSPLATQVKNNTTLNNLSNNPLTTLGNTLSSSTNEIRFMGLAPIRSSVSWLSTNSMCFQLIPSLSYSSYTEQNKTLYQGNMGTFIKTLTTVCLLFKCALYIAIHEVILY